jgi:hypothetical protein
MRSADQVAFIFLPIAFPDAAHLSVQVQPSGPHDHC